MSESKTASEKVNPDFITVDANNVSGISTALHLSAMKHMGIPVFQGAPLELMFLGTALGGEVGELQNYLKKIVRDGKSDELLEAAGKEIADVFAYLMHIANFLGVNAQQIFIAKTSEIVNDRKPEWAMDAITQLRRNLNGKEDA